MNQEKYYTINRSIIFGLILTASKDTDRVIAIFTKRFNGFHWLILVRSLAQHYALRDSRLD